MKKTLSTLVIVMTTGLLTLSVFSKEFPNSDFTNPHFCELKDRDFREIRYRDEIPVCFRRVSYGTRQKIYDLYKVPKENRKNYTIDHLIPLSLGGSNNIRNLWPQPRNQHTGALEYQIYLDVKRGELSVQEAWNLIVEEKYPDEI